MDICEDWDDSEAEGVSEGSTEEERVGEEDDEERIDEVFNIEFIIAIESQMSM